jgi:hypothetical protein
VRSQLRTLLTISVLWGISTTLSAQDASLGFSDTPLQPDGRWHIHDGTRPQPDSVRVGSIVAIPAPSDATVLFNVNNDLNKWQMVDEKPVSWTAEDGILKVGNGDLRTKAEFTDFQLHLEFSTPTEIKGDRQQRGNSGVYLLGKFEIRILDSFKNPTYPDGQAAAMYGQYSPLVNSTRAPGEWQSLDIAFSAPRFSKGHLDRPAVVTVLHNGIVVHNATAFHGPTLYKNIGSYTLETQRGPIQLQGRGNGVQFRNIWIREIKNYN